LDEEEHSVASHPRRNTEGFLRDLCTYGHITGIAPSVFKYYERIDGSPVLPGVDWDCPTDEGKKKWTRRFLKSTWRNTKDSMLLRRKFPKHQVDKHTHSLPRDFSISDYLKPRRSVLRSQDRCPELPEWTAEHYESQFLSNMDINLDTLKSQICHADLGRATLVAAGAEVEGRHVDWSILCNPNSSGFCVFDCNGVQVQAKRVPRGTQLGERALDVFGISVVQGDTSRPTTFISRPFSLGRDERKVFFSVTTSSAIPAKYAEARAEKLGDGLGTEAAMVIAERALHTRLLSCPEREQTFCIEFEGVKFVPHLLQDPELGSHFDFPISCEHMFAKGVTEDRGVTSPFVTNGFNFKLAIDGRSDLLDHDHSKTAFITKKLKDFTLSLSTNEEEVVENEEEVVERADNLQGACDLIISFIISLSIYHFLILSSLICTDRKSKKASTAKTATRAPAATMNRSARSALPNQSSRMSTRQQSSKATTRGSAAASSAQTQPRQKQNKKSGKATARAATAAPAATGTRSSQQTKPSARAATTAPAATGTRSSQQTKPSARAATAAPAATGTRSSQQTKPSANVTAAAKKMPAKKTPAKNKAPARKTPAKKTVRTAAAPSVQNDIAAGTRPPPSSSVPVKKKKSTAATTPASNSKRANSSRKTNATAATTSTRTHKSQIVSEADDSSLGDTINSRFTADDGSVLELHPALARGDCLVHSLNGNNNQDDAVDARHQIVHHMVANPVHYRDVLGEASYSEVVRQVLTPGEHVGHEFIQAWADAFGDTVVIFDEAGDTTNRFSPSTDDENFTSAYPSGVTRYIVYNGHNHYDYLLPIEEGSTDEESDEAESAEEEGVESEVESVKDVEVESAEDYNDGEDIVSEDGDELGSDEVEEMYDNEGGSGELGSVGDGMSVENESDYNSVDDGYPDIGHEEGEYGEEVGYSGSVESESDSIPMPQERVESSPSGSPSDRFLAAARSAASRVLGLGRDLSADFDAGRRRDSGADFDAGRRRDSGADFDAGRRRESRRRSKAPQRFSPSSQ